MTHGATLGGHAVKAAVERAGIAGGSGITPILSILKAVLGAEPKSRFTLIYGNRRQRSTMFAEELEDLKNRYLSRLTLHMQMQEQLSKQAETLFPGVAGRNAPPKR